VAEYLNDVATTYPADSELLDAIAPTYLGTDEALHKCFIRKTLISAVARALTPGCKVDTVCILQGLQGCGKSTFWKILASEPWFDDTVTNASDKDERLKLHQSWLIEWAELEAIFKRKDISAVKAFITTQCDQVRPPYGRDILEMARPSIIVGSTNETEFLADPTGNRRYWVIPVAVPSIDLDKLAAERDRIWAAAVHAFKSGEGWTLPPEMRQVAKADSENYTFSDPWEDLLLSYCEDLKQITLLRS
jgi:predicted P-loop ATPase